jgi:hypothetical protein
VNIKPVRRSRAHTPKSAPKTGSVVTAAVNRLREIFGKNVPAAQTPYRPKFCRTRGCTLDFAHEGGHDVVTGKLAPFAGRKVRDKITGRMRPVKVTRPGRVTAHYEPRRSPKAAAVPGAALHMAEIRAHRNPAPEGALTAKQHRAARALRKASTR